VEGTKEDLLKKTVAEIERHIIESALRRTNGNGREAAKQLGTTHRMLMYRIRKYGINVESYRNMKIRKTNKKMRTQQDP
jgi:transcriptional regulator with GAF, ATPase, and Fis domain